MCVSYRATTARAHRQKATQKIETPIQFITIDNTTLRQKRRSIITIYEYMSTVGMYAFLLLKPIKIVSI